MRRSALPFVLCLSLAVSPFVAAADGDPDVGFSDDGFVALPWSAETIQAETREVAIADDGSVVTASWSSYTGQPTGQAGSISVTRLLGDGTPDAAFGVDGTVEIDLNPAPRTFERPRALALDATGRVLVAAGFEIDEDESIEHAALVRLLADGSPDPSFGTGGRRVYDVSPWSADAELEVRDAAIDDDGSAVFALSCRGCDSDDYDLVLLRTGVDGTPDVTFGDGGWARFASPVDHEFPTSVAFAASGRIVVAGGRFVPGSYRRPFVMRWTDDGVPDAAFADAGFALLAFDDFEPTAIVAHWPALVPLGERVFVGMENRSGGDLAQIVALDALGDIDDDFGNAGVLDLSLEEGTRIGAFAIDAFDRLMVAGTIDPNGVGVADFLVVRTTFDGAMDASFDGNGKARYVFPGVGRYDTASAIALSPRHAVIAGTLDDNIASTRHVGVLRLGLRLKTVFGDGFEP